MRLELTAVGLISPDTLVLLRESLSMCLKVLPEFFLLQHFRVLGLLHLVVVDFYRVRDLVSCACACSVSLALLVEEQKLSLKTNKIHSLVSLLSFFIRICFSYNSLTEIQLKFIWCVFLVSQEPRVVREEHRFEVCMPWSQHTSSSAHPLFRQSLQVVAKMAPSTAVCSTPCWWASQKALNPLGPVSSFQWFEASPYRWRGVPVSCGCDGGNSYGNGRGEGCSGCSLLMGCATCLSFVPFCVFSNERDKRTRAPRWCLCMCMYRRHILRCNQSLVPCALVWSGRTVFRNANVCRRACPAEGQGLGLLANMSICSHKVGSSRRLCSITYLTAECYFELSFYWEIDTLPMHYIKKENWLSTNLWFGCYSSE